MKVDFITFCYKGDYHRPYKPGWLQKIVGSHKFHFSTLRIVHQDLRGTKVPIPPAISTFDADALQIVRSEGHPNILDDFGIPEQDDKADHYTHGPGAPHYWKNHVRNHLYGLKASDADYIVFSDSDCFIRSSDPDQNWIREGIRILQTYPQVLIVSPGDGAVMCEAQTQEGYRLTQNVSQQLFLCERERFAMIDFNVPWDWEHTAPGGPMQEYYYMLEGRIWRYIDREGLWRCILPDYVARYWHCGLLTEDGYFEDDYSKY